MGEPFRICGGGFRRRPRLYCWCAWFGSVRMSLGGGVRVVCVLASDCLRFRDCDSVGGCLVRPWCYGSVHVICWKFYVKLFCRFMLQFFGPLFWLCLQVPFIASGLGLGFVKRVQKICTLDWNESCVYQYQCAEFVEQMRREIWIGLEQPVRGVWYVFGWGPPFWTLFGQNKITNKRDKD